MRELGFRRSRGCPPNDRTKLRGHFERWASADACSNWPVAERDTIPVKKIRHNRIAYLLSSFLSGNLFTCRLISFHAHAQV
jgi:hypothetical protein